MGCNNDIPNYSGGYNCNHNMKFEDLPGIVNGKSESKEDFYKRKLINSCSIKELNVHRLLHEEKEEYEWCAFIRDLIRIKQSIKDQEKAIIEYLKTMKPIQL